MNTSGATLTHHLNQMKLSALVAIAAVIGGSFLISVPADAQYFDPYSDPFDNEFNRAADRTQREIDNFDWGTPTRSTCTVTHAYGDTYNTSCY